MRRFAFEGEEFNMTARMVELVKVLGTIGQPLNIRQLADILQWESGPTTNSLLKWVQLGVLTSGQNGKFKAYTLGDKGHRVYDQCRREAIAEEKQQTQPNNDRNNASDSARANADSMRETLADRATADGTADEDFPEASTESDSNRSEDGGATTATTAPLNPTVGTTNGATDTTAAATTTTATHLGPQKQNGRSPARKRMRPRGRTGRGNAQDPEEEKVILQNRKRLEDAVAKAFSQFSKGINSDSILIRNDNTEARGNNGELKRNREFEDPTAGKIGRQNFSTPLRSKGMPVMYRSLVVGSDNSVMSSEVLTPQEAQLLYDSIDTSEKSGSGPRSSEDRIKILEKQVQLLAKELKNIKEKAAGRRGEQLRLVELLKSTL